MTPRGRPPSPNGPQTPAERKRAQRERNTARLWASGVSLDTLPLSALLEALPGLIADDRPGTLSAVLIEVGRRGGVVVAAKPSGSPRGTRIKA